MRVIYNMYVNYIFYSTTIPQLHYAYYLYVLSMSYTYNYILYVTLFSTGVVNFLLTFGHEIHPCRKIKVIYRILVVNYILIAMSINNLSSTTFFGRILLTFTLVTSSHFILFQALHLGSILLSSVHRFQFKKFGL